MTIDRRLFLGSGLGLLGIQAASAGAMAAIDRARVLPAHRRSGTILDVEHVVILMQENRSFDHYFGTLGGVRGYNDRITVPPRQGRTVWQQADGRGGTVSPFLMDRDRVDSQHVHSLPHSWADGHAAGNDGRWDNWVPAKGAMTMAGYAREDIPFQHALADAFTVCDAYYCSIPSSTNPNRTFLMSGTVDPAGQAGGPMFVQPAEDEDYNLARARLYGWTTYPERLEAAGIDWRVYQGLDDDDRYRPDPQDAIAPRRDSARYGSLSRVSCFNNLRLFKAFHDATPGSPLYEKALVHRPPSAFAADVRASRLPAVSWICPPLNCSEHPSRTPAEGAMFVAQVLNALTANPDTWSRTALFVLYDENDGFFDHVLPPMPPTRGRGASNVDTDGEIRSEDGLPYGLGPRVPAFVISPWSRGGAVCSQVFDHTSVIRFLETRFGVPEPNISPWRRAVCGDLTAAFDFANPHFAAPEGLPDTSGYRRDADADAHAAREPAHVPVGTALPPPSLARRPFRPTPYRCDAEVEVVSSQSIRLTLRNTGQVAAVFQVFDNTDEEAAPRLYTVAAGTELHEAWNVADSGLYDLYILGPVALLRHFRGHTQRPAMIRVAETADALKFTVSSASPSRQTFQFYDRAYGATEMRLEVAPGQSARLDWPLTSCDHWYDIEIILTDGAFVSRLAGHVETGKPSMSPPGL